MVFIKQLLKVFVSPWMLLLAGTILLLYIVPGDWIPLSGGEKLAARYEAATLGLSGNEVAHLVGRAEAGAAVCNYRFDRNSAAAVLSHVRASLADVAPDGALYAWWRAGYGAPPPCASVLAWFGPEGYRIPTLVYER